MKLKLIQLKRTTCRKVCIYYNVFIVFLVLTYYRTTVGIIMLTSELVYSHSLLF